MQAFPEDWTTGCTCDKHQGTGVVHEGHDVGPDCVTRWTSPDCPKHGQDAPTEPGQYLMVVRHPEPPPADPGDLVAAWVATWPRETSYTVTRTCTPTTEA